MASNLESIPAAKPLAPWFGGKKYLAKKIIERIEAVDHRCYAEPFVGMGGVFLRRARRPNSEAINDISGELVNLFRCLKEHGDELTRQFEWTLSSRAEFERFVDTPPTVLTDIQRAARFAYMQNMTFGGKPAMDATRGQIGTHAHHPARLTAEKMQRSIAEIHQRLQRVHINASIGPSSCAATTSRSRCSTSTRRTGVMRRTTARASSPARILHAWRNFWPASRGGSS